MVDDSLRFLRPFVAAVLILGSAGCTADRSDTSVEAACDPSAADADRQVVEAFLIAYNAQDLDRLEELAPVTEIWDPAGIPHLGEVAWTDLAPWAEGGWEVMDHLLLVEFTSYGPSEGSDIVVRRTNKVLADAGVESFDFSFKVPSTGCSIQRLIGGIGTFGDPRGQCEFYGAFADEILALVPSLTIPTECLQDR